MKSFDCMTAAHKTRAQLSGILCERSLTKEEELLHISVCRILNRCFAINDENIRVSNEEPPRLPDTSQEKNAPGEEPGLLSSD